MIKEFDRMKFPVDDKHRIKELEQKVEIMGEYISAIESKDSQKPSNLVKDDSYKKRESEQEKLILKELNKKIEEKAELDKTQFLTMISHELKTPLVPIKAYAEMLESEKFGEISETQRKKLKAIDDGARDLIQLISNMIEYQKFSSEKVNLEKKQNDVKKIIHEAHLFFSSEFDSKGMKINSTFSKPLWIECDGTRIHQVLTNLLHISLYSVPKKHPKIIVNVWEKAKGVEISVWSNGETISKEGLEKIFSDFYKADTSNIRSNGGIGLALALCKKIIEAHGGRIWATTDSDIMKITFTIPKLTQ